VQLGRSWADIEDAGVHSKQRLVDRGLYAFIRHPIYTGDIVMLLGLELALNSWLVLGIVVLAPVVARQAIREEAMLARTLPDYDAYRRRTKRFVPFVF
jgi:protein-S-isoprenylcysteine O-methyltransferase Ste14